MHFCCIAASLKKNSVPYRLANHKNQGNYNNQRCKLYGKDYKVATLYKFYKNNHDTICWIDRTILKTFSQDVWIDHKYRNTSPSKNLKSEGKKVFHSFVKVCWEEETCQSHANLKFIQESWDRIMENWINFTPTPSLFKPLNYVRSYLI